MHRAIANRPEHARALEDARQHITCAVGRRSSRGRLGRLRSAFYGRSAACLLDQLAAVSAALESRSAGRVSLRRPS